MSGGSIIEFKKVFVKCTVPTCKKKHYARGYCEKHYHNFCRGKYRFTLEKYSNLIKHKISKRLMIKKPINVIEKTIKYKTTDALYQQIKDKKITTFQYKDIMYLMNWKYEKTKKHVLRLVKLQRVIPIGNRSGGRKIAFKLII